MVKNKHLSSKERELIGQGLKDGFSLGEIGRSLGRGTTTISREVKRHVQDSDKYPAYRIHNRCVKRGNCSIRQLCEDKPDCTRVCSRCGLCNKACPDFDEQVCFKLYDPPYCCNGCFEEGHCVMRKKYYLHKKAHEAYREALVESRSGANITEDDLLYIDSLVSPLIKRGQSVHHVSVHNADRLTVSEKTLYRYVDGGLLQARNIDMPRVCRIKPRKTKTVERKVDKTCRVGRTYVEYLSFIEASGVQAVEMDSVLGRVGGKVLLTLIFKNCDFMLAFIRDRNTSQSVIDAFDALHAMFGLDLFKTLFPILLGDNGSEFSNPVAIENSGDGVPRTKVFYCDPYSSFQKPNVELNHEFIRKFLPKGKPFDHLFQADINLMMSHINSYSREKLNDKSPLEVFGYLYDKDIPERLGIHHIPPNDITLNTSIFNKE